MELEGVLGDTVIPVTVLCFLFGFFGLILNSFILRYYGRKAKLDQLSIIYSSLTILALILSVLLLLAFLFFFLPDMYFPFTVEGYSQTTAGIFFAGLHKILLMAGQRGSVMITSLLVFLTACKVKWKIFKIRTRLLRAFLSGYPGLLVIILAVNCAVELRVSTPFYIPWISRTEGLVVIYFWVTLILPSALTLASALFLLLVVLCSPSSLAPEESGVKLSSVLATIKEEIGVGGQVEEGPTTRSARLKGSLTRAAGKVTTAPSNISAKFDNRDVTKRTIFTILLLVVGQIAGVVATVAVALPSIYSDDNLLDYDKDNTEERYSCTVGWTVLFPLGIIVLLNPLLLLLRVNGLNRAVKRCLSPLCEPCAAAWRRRQIPVDA